MKPECITCPIQVRHSEIVAEHDRLVEEHIPGMMSSMERVNELAGNAPEIQSKLDELLSIDNPTKEDLAEIDRLQAGMPLFDSAEQKEGVFRAAIIEGLETSRTLVEANTAYTEAISEKCGGPYVRKRYFLFGDKILLCSNAPTPKRLRKPAP